VRFCFVYVALIIVARRFVSFITLSLSSSVIQSQSTRGETTSDPGFVCCSVFIGYV